MADNALAVWRRRAIILFATIAHIGYNQFTQLKTVALRETADGMSDTRKGDCHYE